MPQLILNKTFNAISGVGKWAFLIGDATREAFKKPPRFTLFLDQLFQIGVLSLPVVAITGFSTGLVLAAQSFYQLSNKGLSSATGLFVAKSMLTEVGPVLTAFMITGRVGSSICAILGSMRVTEQIDAMKSMAVSPIRYLVAPRLLASLIMVPLLTIFSALMGIYGGYLISVFLFGMSPEGYYDPIPANVNPFDLATGIIKGLVFGFFISSIACYKGLTTSGGAEGVGRSITQSVVTSYTVILIINFILTIALNLFHLSFIKYFR